MPQRFERFLLCVGEGFVGAREAVQNICPLPVSIGADVIDGFEKHGFGTEHAIDFGLAPDIEAAFLPFASGIEQSYNATSLLLPPAGGRRARTSVACGKAVEGRFDLG